jgi:hypothetical protein
LPRVLQVDLDDGAAARQRRPAPLALASESRPAGALARVTSFWATSGSSRSASTAPWFATVMVLCRMRVMRSTPKASPIVCTVTPRSSDGFVLH